jgi:hypothetical protein
MSAASPTDPKANAARLLEALEVAVATLAPEVLLELRPAVARIGEAIVSRALGAALGQAKASEQEYGLKAAAGVLGRSERWLRAHRRELRLGYQLNGGGPWRFTQRELDRVMESARTRRR